MKKLTNQCKCGAYIKDNQVVCNYHLLDIFPMLVGHYDSDDRDALSLMFTEESVVKALRAATKL